MSVKLEDQVKSIAKDLGFEDCRFARAQKASHAEEFQDWLDDDKHGDMEWMAKNPERRKNPSLLFEGAKTVIVLALNYFPKESSTVLLVPRTGIVTLLKFQNFHFVTSTQI